MAVYIAAEISFEKEHRLQFVPQSPSCPHVVFSGQVDTSGQLFGDSDDDYKTYDVQFVVGPWLRDVKEVVPSLKVNGFLNQDADEDDRQSWIVENLKWDTIGGTGEFRDLERIRLNFTARVLGESSQITNIGYYVIANAKDFGKRGLSSP